MTGLHSTVSSLIEICLVWILFDHDGIVLNLTDELIDTLVIII